MEEKSVKWIVWLVLGIKIAVIGVLFLAYFTLTYCQQCREVNFLYYAKDEKSVVWPLTTWDAQHYIYLAEKGYGPGRMSNAFFPLFPFTIVLLNLVTNNSVFSGLLASGIFAIGSAGLFYLLVRKIYSRQTAFWSLALFLSFPASMFFHLIYSESLFLFLLLLLYWGYFSGKNFLVYIAAFLLPLSRFQGILVVLPLLLTAVIPSEKEKSKLSFPKLILPLGFFGGGILVYLGLMKFWTGSGLAGFEALKLYVTRYSISNLLNPLQWFIGNFLTLPYSLHGFNTSLIDRSFFIFFLIWLWPSYRILPRIFFWQMIVLGLLPAMAGYFMSYPRYLLAAFPMFITAAKMMKGKTIILVFPMLLLQGLFTVWYGLNYWVA